MSVSRVFFPIFNFMPYGSAFGMRTNFIDPYSECGPRSINCWIRIPFWSGSTPLHARVEDWLLTCWVGRWGSDSAPPAACSLIQRCQQVTGKQPGIRIRSEIILHGSGSHPNLNLDLHSNISTYKTNLDETKKNSCRFFILLPVTHLKV